MTPIATEILTYLHGERPDAMPAAKILADLNFVRAQNNTVRKPADRDEPIKPAALGLALAELAEAERAECDGGGLWHWRPEVVRREALLF